MPVRASFRFAALACAAGLLAGCGGSSNSGAGSVAPLAAPNAPGGPVTGKIAHVVILIQENRSFDNLFYGFPGADTATAGLRHDGTSVALGPVPLEDGRDIGHFHYSFELAFDGGRMDGFDLEQGYGFVNGAYTVVPQDPDLPYSYVPHAESAPYIQLAQQYTLADRMFESNNGPSYPSHQYLIAGQSDDADEVPTKGPWGCDAPPGTTVAQLLPNGTDSNGVFPCFDYETLGDLLDAAGISWRYYVPPFNDTAGTSFSAYDAIKHIRYGTDWTRNVINPQTQIFSDIAAGTLPQVSWVIPTFADSDHPLAHSNTGPSWIASVVDALGTSPYWNSTAIFILWDDWGGWYDHVPPPQLDHMGLGFRIPLIVVSPYAKHGYVSHVQHEEASILHFIEEDFGLPSLGETDLRADDLSDCFDFSQPPSAFARIAAPYGKLHFLLERQTGEPPDPI